MHAHRQEVIAVTGRIALVSTLWLVPLIMEGAPVEGAEYQFEGRVSYVSNGNNNEIDLTGAFQINERFVLSCKIDPSNMLPAGPGQPNCTNCVTELTFSVGDYGGTMQPGSFSVLRLLDNAAESGTVCGGQDPEVDEFVVIATGISAPHAASVPILYAGFGLIDCQAGAWASVNLPNPDHTLDSFEFRQLILVFSDGSRTGAVYATISGAVVPVAQSSWGSVKVRYR